MFSIVRFYLLFVITEQIKYRKKATFNKNKRKRKTPQNYNSQTWGVQEPPGLSVIQFN